ncbi:MAG TPA: ABC transporter permease [Chloroflexi bacterium]|nr:ABC transporter permease [Chloroflexota bacterium]
MLRILVRRLLAGLLVLWAAATLTFLALHLLPGDPVTVQMARSGASAAQIARRRAALGWDDPLATQYLRFLTRLLQGDLGRSWSDNRPVLQVLADAVPATFELAVAALGLALLIGGALGTVAALRAGSRWDAGCMALALTGLSSPVAWSGLLGILLFSVWLGWLPASGREGPLSLVLPALTLGWTSAGSIARMVRASLLEVLGQRYVTVAQAKGLPWRQVLLRHVGTVALPPILTLLALQSGFLLGGTVITETIFARPGLGRLALNAVLVHDLPLVQGIVLLGAAVYTLVNLLADLAQLWLDPRLREASW